MSSGLLEERGRNAQLCCSMKSEATTHCRETPGPWHREGHRGQGKDKGDRKDLRGVIEKLSLLEEDILGGR